MYLIIISGAVTGLKMEMDTEDSTSDSFVQSSGVSTGTSTRPQSLQLLAETSYSSVETQEVRKKKDRYPKPK